MSRSGYIDDGDMSDIALWRDHVASAVREKRGQNFLRDLVAGLDAMPEKKLITHQLQCGYGMCALGVVGHFRGIDLSPYNPSVDDEWDDTEDLSIRRVAKILDIEEPLAMEVAYLNDEQEWADATPEARWQRMRDWAFRHLEKADAE